MAPTSSNQQLPAPPSTELPPHYVLLSGSQLLSTTASGSGSGGVGSSSGSGAAPLLHPTIHYHYADDPALTLLPSPNERVLIMDYDPLSTDPPVVRSLSDKLVVTGVKVTEARGVVMTQGEAVNGNMYVIETAAPVRSWNPPEDSSQDAISTSNSIMASFRQRNELLRQALEFPLVGAAAESQQQNNNELSPPPQDVSLPS
ncbi:hypothetical protein BOTBODRAFT_531963 [Botryobasidium botryosum FD-172 SS1]|uniref:Uncharacterized protein n=1 Tax=Botryobasidium botryosum (strain FD-172 SS1) TaxID=930990 RepID=A0A067M0L4_BOTB1|nr:hypothetical protein BOTBODRAFT_531963 [Botryobasidium botryosum FD-172 SS1]